MYFAEARIEHRFQQKSSTNQSIQTEEPFVLNDVSNTPGISFVYNKEENLKSKKLEESSSKDLFKENATEKNIQNSQANIYKGIFPNLGDQISENVSLINKPLQAAQGSMNNKLEDWIQSLILNNFVNSYNLSINT